MELKGLIGGSYSSAATLADCERTRNFYPEILQSENATKQRVLHPTPGVMTLSTAALGSGRGHLSLNGREFAVIGGTFYEVSANGTLTSRGAVTLDGNPATISSNGDAGNELFITSGRNGYIFDLGTNTLTQIAALNGKAFQGGHLDGFFIALDDLTSTVYFSDLVDGLTWTTGVQFVQRSAQPDRWKAMKVVGRYLWLLGDYTSEIWYTVGDLIPFALYPSAPIIPYGIRASFSAALVGDDIVWLAQDQGGRVCFVQGTGFDVRIISTYPLESDLFDYVGAQNAIGDSYSERGHTFYLCGFDAAGVTWAWDAEGIWHERTSWNSALARHEAWRPRFYAYAFGQHRMLDGAGGALFQMSGDFTLDADGSFIRRSRQVPAFVEADRLVWYPALTLLLEPGLGNALPPGDDPQVMLRISNDGGKTWIAEIWAGAGKIGEYARRVRWRRLGSARRRVFEFVMTDPVPWRIVGGELEEPDYEARVRN